MEKPRSTAPIIAALMLLLPLLYVGSYLVLVIRRPVVAVSLTYPTIYSADYYRIGGEYAEALYWPLEQIDRMLQPGAWESINDTRSDLERIGVDFGP